MKRIILLCVLALAAGPGRSQAFDGIRKGFILGVGLGLSPTASWSSGHLSEHKAGAGWRLAAGYAWDESNILAGEGNGVIYHSRFNTDSLIGQGSLLTTQGFIGAAWYHFYERLNRSLFTAAGLGLYAFDPGTAIKRDPGGGYLLGAGYQFAPHLQAAVYFSGGRSFQHRWMLEPGGALGHNHLSVLLSGLIF